MRDNPGKKNDFCRKIRKTCRKTLLKQRIKVYQFSAKARIPRFCLAVSKLIWIWIRKVMFVLLNFVYWPKAIHIILRVSEELQFSFGSIDFLHILDSSLGRIKSEKVPCALYVK